MEAVLASTEVKQDAVLQSEVQETELLRNSPIMISDEENTLTESSNQAQTARRDLPERGTEIEPDLEGLRDPVSDLSVNNKPLGKEIVGCDTHNDSQTKESAKNLKLDIACFRKRIQHGVERVIGTVVRARLPLLMERIARRDMQQIKAKEEQAARSGQNERSSPLTRMKNCLRKGRAVRLKPFGIAAMFMSRPVMNQLKKERKGKAKFKKDEIVQSHTMPEVGKSANNTKSSENTKGDANCKNIEEKTRKGKELIIHFDKETAQSVLENELKHFELAKRRFELQEQKSQKLLILREKREWNFKPSLTSSFCFSYLPPLYEQTATVDDEAESSCSDVENENDDL